MSESVITVIVPVYQAEKNISKCIESLKRQTYTNFIALFVDDGSTDASVQIIKKLTEGDDRFEVLSKANGGAASARNFAISKIKTKYAAFLDCDDWLEDNALEVMLELMIKSNADLVQCSFFYDFENGRSYAPSAAFKENFVTDKDGYKKIYKKIFSTIALNQVWHSLFERSLLEGLTMPENMQCGEDLFFMIDIYTRSQRYAFTAEPLFHYLRHDDSLTGSSLKLKEKIRCNVILSKKLASKLREWKMNTAANYFKAYFRLIVISLSKIYRKIIVSSNS